MYRQGGFRGTRVEGLLKAGHGDLYREGWLEEREEWESNMYDPT